MEILALIKNDHDRLKALLQRLVNKSESAPEVRKEVLQRLREELVVHARAEEAVLYNSMRSADAPTDMVYHGFTEHVEIEAGLLALEAMDYVDVAFTAAAERFQHLVTHHLDEEETDLFPEVRAVMAPEELEVLGEAFRTLKPQIREQSTLAQSLEFIANLLPPRFNVGSTRHLPQS